MYAKDVTCIRVCNGLFYALSFAHQTISNIRITCQTISNPGFLVLFADVPGFHKQVERFPCSRYDCGLQASSRILPT
jgi:hypothetical protein